MGGAFSVTGDELSKVSLLKGRVGTGLPIYSPEFSVFTLGRRKTNLCFVAWLLD